MDISFAPRALDYLLSGLCEQKEDSPVHSHCAVAKLCGKLSKNIQVEFNGNNSEITTVTHEQNSECFMRQVCSERNRYYSLLEIYSQ